MAEHDFVPQDKYFRLTQIFRVKYNRHDKQNLCRRYGGGMEIKHEKTFRPHKHIYRFRNTPHDARFDEIRRGQSLAGIP